MSDLVRSILVSVFIYALLPSPVSAKDKTILLLFGDSIIAGYGLEAEESLPAQLQAILEKDHAVQVINGGVSGDTTGAGRGRLAWTLNKHHPDIVLLALGGNDVLRGIPPRITRENIAAMLALLKEREITTVLSAVWAPDNLGEAYREQFNAIYPKAADQYGVPLYPFLLSKTFGNKDLMQSDGIHPNAEGAKLIAHDLAEYFKEDEALSSKISEKSMTSIYGRSPSSIDHTASQSFSSMVHTSIMLRGGGCSGLPCQ